MALYCHEPNDLDSALLADPATVLCPETVPRLAAAHTQLHIPAIGSIKDRFSKTAGHDYFSQGCAHCDALFGDFFIHQETWANIWASSPKQDYPFQASLPWPIQAAVNAAHSLNH
jgi:hypothetical protein